MGIPIFFIFFITIVFIFRYNMRKNSMIESQENDAFWDKEHESHYIRKQELTEEDLIDSHGSDLPLFDIELYEYHDMTRLLEYQETCHRLKDQPMMNMTGMLNSDIRLKYGTSQVETVEAYENTYLQYLNALYSWAKGLSDHGLHLEAIKLLEISVKTGTDISHHYILLGDLYKRTNNTAQLTELINLVESSDFIMKGKILTALTESSVPIPKE